MGKSTTVYFAGGRHDFSTIEGKWLATFQDVHAKCLIHHCCACTVGKELRRKVM